MGNVILCLGNTAKKPYVLENLGISVFTVEELCYCIKENAFLMDSSIVCRELIDWIGEECGLTELADSLYAFLRLKTSVSAFLSAILEYTGYYPEKEVGRITQFLKAAEGQNEYEKRKRVADYLAGNGKMRMAEERYWKLFKLLPEEYTEFRARLLHNIGYVNCRLFQFEKAAGLFFQAYRMSGEKASLVHYLAAKRMAMDEKEYVDFVTQHTAEYYEVSMELEQRIERLTEQWKESVQAKELSKLLEDEAVSPEAYRSRLYEEAEQMKEKYRRMVREK